MRTYWTTTVKLVLLLTLPAFAVTVTVYVPDGVPGVVWDDEPPPPPPQPTKEKNAKTISGLAIAGSRRRTNRIAKASRTIVHA